MNEAQQSGAGNKERNRRLSIAATLMFLLAAGMSGSFLYLQRKSQREPTKPTAWMVPDISPAQRQKIIDRTGFLRDKWRPWALAHRTELQHMLKAKANDQAAFGAVWNQLPANPIEGGITSEDLVPSGNILVGIGFGWAPMSRGRQNPSPQAKAQEEAAMKKLDAKDPDIRKVMESGRKQLAYGRQLNFGKQRDIELADALQGRTLITLWVSGRITERKMLSPEERMALIDKLIAEHRKVRGFDVFHPHHEIGPPYEFLSPNAAS